MDNKYLRSWCGLINSTGGKASTGHHISRLWADNGLSMALNRAYSIPGIQKQLHLESQVASVITVTRWGQGSVITVTRCLIPPVERHSGSLFPQIWADRDLWKAINHAFSYSGIQKHLQTMRNYCEQNTVSGDKYNSIMVIQVMKHWQTDALVQSWLPGLKVKSRATLSGYRIITLLAKNGDLIEPNAFYE